MGGVYSGGDTIGWAPYHASQCKAGQHHSRGSSRDLRRGRHARSADLPCRKSAGGAIVNSTGRLDAAIEECVLHAEVLREALAELGSRQFDASSVSGLGKDQRRLLDQMAYRFGKLQDTLGEKVLPDLLDLAEEPLPPSVTFAEKLQRLERLNIVESASRRSLGSNLTKVAKHRIRDEEYVELPDLTDEMLARGMKYKPVEHNHESFLGRARARKGFSDAYDVLELEYQVADQLLKARARAGLTQDAVAELMGTTKSAISRLESAGKHAPSLSTLKRYASAVGCKLQVRLVREK